MEERIQTAYNNIRVLPAEENPVKKILLVVTGREAEVYLDEGDPEIGPNLRQAEERDQLLALHLRSQHCSAPEGLSSAWKRTV
jgi:hypothetical protein